ncbi:MAG TPA: M42 family metallopeptidase [Candidatus Borkfalkia faecipullorum]|uniref:M42 family metallopeptidase n=1 Tax=Candidatus Borkfalkia faecipullorum TaxID=2838510 RepID=A0A9D2AFS3_9FIRM|nr:M42 family metallopeptidase [Candidatus Borkfalkia faecipullorum]
MKAENYREFIVGALNELMSADSPTGFPEQVNRLLKDKLGGMGYAAEESNKRLVKVSVAGRKGGLRRAVSAHTDTLGAMVRGVDADGKLRFTCLGGPVLPTFDGEYCRIYARGGKVYTGTFLCDSCSCHVFQDAGKLERTEKTMFVRLDEDVRSAQEVAALGIGTGCFIALDPKTTVTGSGFVKSRFLDDKAGSVCLLTALYRMKQEGLLPEYDTDFYFTNYEETGHGAASISGADELLAVDMGCVGGGLACRETQVSVCAKDSRGPYDHEMVERLISLAEAEGIDYAVDVYPHYGSDVGAAWSAGADLKGGLIGPGVHASHGMERTHLKGIFAAADLLCAYLGLGKSGKGNND